MRLMRHRVLAVLVAISPLPALAEPIPVPSGQPIEFFEVIWEAEGDLNIYRFRYIAPEIARNGGRIDFDLAEVDIKHLCETSALPALIEQGRSADKIIVSISDRQVEFGTTAPDATQFFEVYAPDDSACIWEGF